MAGPPASRRVRLHGRQLGGDLLAERLVVADGLRIGTLQHLLGGLDQAVQVGVGPHVQRLEPAEELGRGW